MKNAKRLVVSLAGMAALALAGCMFIPAAPTGSIEGFVVDHGSGEPVVGAVVLAYPEGGDVPLYTVGSAYYGPVATTDASGHYKLTVPEGIYTVRAEKDGQAVSIIQGVVVGSTAKLDIIQKPVFNPGWPLEPPEVEVTIEGNPVEPGDRIELDAAALADGLDFRVDASGPNDINLIYAALGKTPGAGWLTAPREVFGSTYTSGDATLDPANYGVEGWTTFEVVVYDMNENRVHLIFHVYIPEAAGPPSIGAPTGLTALAVTLGKKVSFYGEPLTVPSGAGELEIHAAPEGGNLYVELTWDASPDDASITGYRIYRKLAGEADFELIGTVAAAGDPTASYTFRDSSSRLAVGVEATYQVRAYQGSTESAAVEASTTPLDVWDVRLLEPADGATGVSLTPTFRWQPTKVVGNDQYYVWVLWDLALGAGYYLATDFLNETQFDYTDLGIVADPYEYLQPHRVYQWYIGEAVAYDDFANPTAISIAVNDVSWLTGNPHMPLPATDLFTFTTGDW
ncbi:TPA: hypothetical protein EYH33_06685 [Candidatus Bipolaricaulota bacterium]|nr:hypothetical protein [Candidatus Bipolaricaulota bacterium]